jgi:hypothetical protein
MGRAFFVHNSRAITSIVSRLCAPHQTLIWVNIFARIALFGPVIAQRAMQ